MASVLLSVTTVGLETIFVLFCVLSAEMMILKSEAENTAEATRAVPPVFTKELSELTAAEAVSDKTSLTVVEEPLGVVDVVVVLLLSFSISVGTVLCVTRPVSGSVTVVVIGVKVLPLVLVETVDPVVPVVVVVVLLLEPMKLPPILLVEPSLLLWPRLRTQVDWIWPTPTCMPCREAQLTPMLRTSRSVTSTNF